MAITRSREFEAGERAQWLKVLAALPEEEHSFLLNSYLDAHIRSARGSGALFSPPCILTHMWHTLTCANTHQ